MRTERRYPIYQELILIPTDKFMFFIEQTLVFRNFYVWTNLHSKYLRLQLIFCPKFGASIRRHTFNLHHVMLTQLFAEIRQFSQMVSLFFRLSQEPAFLEPDLLRSPDGIRFCDFDLISFI